jgi:hypothetical protein
MQDGSGTGGKEKKERKEKKKGLGAVTVVEDDWGQ